MYKISTQHYLKVADKLIAAIGSKEFFSGSVRLTLDDAECVLICTLMIEHEQRPTEGHCFNAISAIIPIWWEFHTTINGEEQLNDFSFNDLKEVIF